MNDDSDHDEETTSIEAITDEGLEKALALVSAESRADAGSLRLDYPHGAR